MVTRKVCSRRNKKTRRHNKKSRKHVKHTLKGGFSLSNAAPVNQKTIGENTAGPNFLATSANYAEPPTLFSDSYGKVRKHGCAGTKSKVSAAKGDYKNMFGGKKLMAICPEIDALASPITGPKSNHPMHCEYSNGPQTRDLALSASYKGGKRKTKSHTKKRGGKSGYPGIIIMGGKRKTKSHTKKRGGSVCLYCTAQSGGVNNVPTAHGYSLGGPLTAKKSALANPPPHKAYNNCMKNNFPLKR